MPEIIKIAFLLSLLYQSILGSEQSIVSSAEFIPEVAVEPVIFLPPEPTVLPESVFNDSKVHSSNDPLVYQWVQSSGMSAYLVVTNVNRVQHNSKFAFITTAGIPSYPIGPWPDQVGPPKNLANYYVFPRVPVEMKEKKVNIPDGGAVGVWINGVSLFGVSDGRTVNGVWRRNEYFFEKSLVDKCSGRLHSNGQYYHRVATQCIFYFSPEFENPEYQWHSPIVGYAFDGFPIYGPIGYKDPKDASSPVQRMKSSYRLRDISERTTLADGTALKPEQYGPPISDEYPLGSFIDDFEYVAGSGDLDEHNGRFSVTPEYPKGTYAYFVTTDTENNPVYPYVMGQQYFGLPASIDLISSVNSAVDFYVYGCYQNDNFYIGGYYGAFPGYYAYDYGAYYEYYGYDYGAYPGSYGNDGSYYDYYGLYPGNYGEDGGAHHGAYPDSYGNDGSYYDYYGLYPGNYGEDGGAHHGSYPGFYDGSFYYGAYTNFFDQDGYASYYSMYDNAYFYYKDDENLFVNDSGIWYYDKCDYTSDINSDDLCAYSYYIFEEKITEYSNLVCGNIAKEYMKDSYNNFYQQSSGNFVNAMAADDTDLNAVPVNELFREDLLNAASGKRNSSFLIQTLILLIAIIFLNRL